MSTHSAKETLAALREQGPMTAAQIAASLGIGIDSARGAIHRLLDSAAIKRAGREQRPYPSRGGGALLWEPK